MIISTIIFTTFSRRSICGSRFSTRSDFTVSAKPFSAASIPSGVSFAASRRSGFPARQSAQVSASRRSGFPARQSAQTVRHTSASVTLGGVTSYCKKRYEKSPEIAHRGLQFLLKSKNKKVWRCKDSDFPWNNRASPLQICRILPIFAVKKRRKGRRYDNVTDDTRRMCNRTGGRSDGSGKAKRKEASEAQEEENLLVWKANRILLIWDCIIYKESVESLLFYCPFSCNILFVYLQEK